MQQATAEQLLVRGVWKAPYLFDGVEVLIAVDSRGCVRKHLKLRGGVDEIRAVQWLEGLLNRIDPPAPRLTLLHPGPRMRVGSDPCERPIEDALTAALRRAKAASRQFYRRTAREP
jgi:hypothetical protein